MTGHNSRRYRFSKRTHINQDLGPFVNHEMNRCIACYRCVRYYNDYAGGKDLGVFGAHDNVYFGRVADGDLRANSPATSLKFAPPVYLPIKPTPITTPASGTCNLPQRLPALLGRL